MRKRQGKLVRKRGPLNEEDYENNPRLLSVLAMIRLNLHLSLHEIETTIGVPRSPVQVFSEPYYQQK